MVRMQSYAKKQIESRNRPYLQGRGRQQRGGVANEGTTPASERTIGREPLRQMLASRESLLDLTLEQEAEVGLILDSEGFLIELLGAQLAKIKRQRQVARQSGVFEDQHERTLARQSSQIETELRLVSLRLRSRIFGVLSPPQRARLEALEIFV
jgi:hypothetical protein